MNKSIALVFLAVGLVACGNSGSSTKMSDEEMQKMIIKNCMRSAGVDVNNPNDRVFPEQLAKIEKCIGH